MPQNPKPQNICPICTKAFGDKDVVIKYQAWNAEDDKPDKKLLGHLDCVLYLSKKEDREHPPKGKAEKVLGGVWKPST